MKPNPKNFEAFIDPEGGEWIKIKTGKYKDIVWRPADMSLDGDEKISFQAEFLSPPPEDGAMFEKVAVQMITDIMKDMT